MKKITQEKLIKKIKAFLKSIWGRKELWIDAIWILGAVIMITCIPSIYQSIPSVLIRVVLILILLMGLLITSIFIIIRVIRRNKRIPLTRMKYLYFILRSLIVMVCIWIFSEMMTRILHPTLGSIYAIELTRTEEVCTTLLNCLFYVLYSQAFLTIFTGIGEELGVFIRRLGKTWLLSVLPMFLMSLLFTFVIQWMKDTAASYVMSVLLTTFLWVTSIALNEKIKGDNNSEITKEKTTKVI